MNSQTNTLSKQNIHVLIMAGGRDFGRCSLASYMPTALWPVAGRSSLKRLLVYLADYGIKHVMIFPGQNKTILNESFQVDSCLEIEYLEEALPIGTAGSIREAAKGEEESLYILMPASIISPPDIDYLINEHLRSDADLTVVLEAANSGNCESEGRACGIFICNNSVLKFIPEGGYSDIKEGLIPKLLKNGKNVKAVTLSHLIGSFRDCREYLTAISNNIKDVAKLNNIEYCENNDNYSLWTGAQVKIDPSARIAGNVILMDNAQISKGAVVIGPSIIGRNVTVGENSVIVNGIVWDNSQIGSNCHIEHTVMDRNSEIYSGTHITGKCIAFKSSEEAKTTEKIMPNIAKKTGHIKTNND